MQHFFINFSDFGIEIVLDLEEIPKVSGNESTLNLEIKNEVSKSVFEKISF